jgi:Fe-S-cluster containining protein
MDFPCTKCGGCCKNIGWIKSRYSEEEFPYKLDEKGDCEMLIENKCSIYNDRPEICRFDKMALKLNIDKKEFYNMNIIFCNNYMQVHNIPFTIASI